MNTEEFKKRAYDWITDVITACNKGDIEELKALMVCGLMTEEEFNDLSRINGALVNDQGVFYCNGYEFQVCENFGSSSTKAGQRTDRYIVWGFAKDDTQSIADVVYWTWGNPIIDNKIMPAVLDQCKKWIAKTKDQGYEPYNMLEV